MCVNFIRERRDLQFNVDSERQIFWETLCCMCLFKWPLQRFSQDPNLASYITGVNSGNERCNDSERKFFEKFSWQFYSLFEFLPEERKIFHFSLSSKYLNWSRGQHTTYCDNCDPFQYFLYFTEKLYVTWNPAQNGCPVISFLFLSENRISLVFRSRFKLHSKLLLWNSKCNLYTSHRATATIRDVYKIFINLLNFI